MSKSFDVIVIGTGSAASVVAMSCYQAGWEVAIIDSRPYGGTCALRGCDPKKVLVGACEAVDGVRRLAGKGVVIAVAFSPRHNSSQLPPVFDSDRQA